MSILCFFEALFDFVFVLWVDILHDYKSNRPCQSWGARSSFSAALLRSLAAAADAAQKAGHVVGCRARVLGRVRRSVPANHPCDRAHGEVTEPSGSWHAFVIQRVTCGRTVPSQLYRVPPRQGCLRVYWLWGAMKRDGILITNRVYCTIASAIALGHAVYLFQCTFQSLHSLSKGSPIFIWSWRCEMSLDNLTNSDSNGFTFLLLW